MNRNTPSRKLRKSLALREHRDEVYTDKRIKFEVKEVYKGFLWWAKPAGWVVNVLRVEGACCSAIMGSIGTVVPHEISPVLPTKFAAYRWLAENIKDWQDVNHYLYDRYF
jgi:hypothetical protein